MPLTSLEPIPSAPAALLFGLAAYFVTVAGVAMFGVAAGLERAGMPYERRLRIGRMVGASLASWFLLLAMSAVSGVYLDAHRPHFIFYALPALLAVVSLLRASWLRSAVAAMPLWWIPALQTLRIGGGSTLFAGWSVGIAPWGFVRTAGTGDILVGLAAAGVAWALAREVRGARRLALLWNVLGLLDILHTLFRAVTSAPGPQQLFFEEPANQIPALFPFLYLPGFIVPLTVLLHLLSLRQLRQAAERSTAGQATATATS